MDFSRLGFLRVIYSAVLIAGISLSSFAQTDDGKYDEFVVGNRIFKPYCGYITISTGFNFNPVTIGMEKCFSIGYHFRVSSANFQAGYHVSSDEFFMRRSYQMLSDIYFLYGYRKDTVKTNIGLYGGLTYGFGSTLDHVEDFNGTFTNYYLSFHKIGLYAEAEYTIKITYDFGLGLSAYASANPRYQVFGLKAHLYFSGAFRGKI